MKLYLKGRIMTALPIVCTIAYLLMGFLADLWHPGWVVFLAIPLFAAILFNKNLKLVSIYTTVIIVAYVVTSVLTGLWHPLWIAFLTIPIFSIFTRPRHLTAEEFCDMVENQNDDCDCGYDAEWEEKIEKEFEEKFDSKDEESKK